MQILYNVKTDLLYLRLDELRQQVMNKRLSEDIVLDMGEEDRIVGIEILDASRHLNLERLLPVEYEELVGASGVAATLLRPVGTGPFGNRRLNVVSDGEYIPKGTAIRIVRVKGNRIVVQQA